MKDPPTKTELKKILSLTAKGTEEIVSTRSKAFRRLTIDIEDMSLHELYELIYDHPEMLRKLIIIDHRPLQEVDNESEIRQFVPKKVRKRELNKAKSMISTFEQIVE